MASYTKGPWVVLDKAVKMVRAKAVNIDVCEVGQAATARGDGYRIAKEQAKANAYLISAAPELFELVLSLRGDIADESLLTRIDEVLNKARGVVNCKKENLRTFRQGYKRSQERGVRLER